MDAQQFLAELGHIANAPGGVSKLREMILALAVQGSLVTQDPADTSATNQVSEIRRLSSLQRFDGKRRRTNGHNSAFIPDPTNLLPAGWSSVRICDIVRVLNGRAYSKQELLDSGTPVLRVGNLFTSHKWYFSDLELEDDKCCENGDLLYAWSASFGPFIWSGERVIFHYHIWKLDLFSTELLNKQYLYTYLLEKTQEIKASGHGISMAHMTKEKFEQLVVPLPPLKEQSRIVAKVDELMALCDQLEAQQQQRRSLQNKLRQSTLQAVAAATTPHELQATWARLADNFGPLFDAPDDVKALRDAIFELAMRGVLLPNATMDVVASEDELPGLPTGWGWKTLGELSEYITSGSRGWKDYIANAGDVFIRSQDIKQDALVFENPAFVALPEKAEGKRTLVKEGDLLLTITGGNVGKCAAVPVLKGKAYVSQHVALIRLNDSNLAEFIHYWMINSHGGRGFLARYIYGDKPGLNLTQVASIPVPIPLESDRARILESLRLYQSMCDRLELQVGAKHKLAAIVAFAATASITGIAATPEEDAPLKAPQTELIAPLRLDKTPDIKAQAPLATILARHNGELPAKDLCQRFCGMAEIDAFYAQLKVEVAHGWILEPGIAEMREKASA